MFIKAPEIREKSIRFAFSLPESRATLLDEYRRFVAGATGQSLEFKELVPLMVDGVLDADKAFQKWRKQAGNADKHKAGRAATPVASTPEPAPQVMPQPFDAYSESGFTQQE